MRWYRPKDYLLEDNFEGPDVAAGSVNGSPTSDAKDVRAVVDTGGDEVAISGGKLVLQNINAAWDAALAYPITPQLAGKVLISKVNFSSVAEMAVGFGQFGTENMGTGHFYSISAAGALIRNGAATPTVTGALSTGVDYLFCVIERATGCFYFIKGGVYTTWTLLWISGATSAALYPQYAQALALWTSDYIRLLRTLWLPQPLASDSFTRANGAIGSTDGAGHAETTGLGSGGSEKVWTGATWTIATNKAINTPTEGVEKLGNPGFETAGTGGADVFANWIESAGDGAIADEGVIVNGGAHACKLTSGATSNTEIYQSAVVIPNTPYRLEFASQGDGVNAGKYYLYDVTNGAYIFPNASTGITGAAYVDVVRDFTAPSGCVSVNLDMKCPFVNGGIAYFDDMSILPLTLSTLFANLEHNEPDVMATAGITLTAGTRAGMVLCLDDAATPANFIIAYHDGTNAHLEKCVAGTYTSLISTAATYGAERELRVVKDATAVTLYYNNVKIGATQTVSDAGIISNTLHGLFSTYSGNSFNLYNCYARHHHKVPEE